MDYSIDLQAEKIVIKKTAAYFKEVITSYHNGSYRSAIVMLYSVTVADLIYKLKELHETYEDKKAAEILEEIENMQKSQPHHPKWESELIEKVYKRTSLLETADYQNIEYLKKLRHLCAHPAIDQNYELHNPSKETVRSCIRNIMEGLLCKPVLVSKEIFNDLLEDIANNKKIFYDDQELKRYLEAKYFNNMNLQVEKQVFKSLWRITLYGNDEECKKNRFINYRALKVILLRHSKEQLASIQSNSPYFSKVAKRMTSYLINLINAYPPIYDALTEDRKIILNDGINFDRNLHLLAWFKSNSLTEHLEYIYSNEFINGEFEHYTISIEALQDLTADIEKNEGIQLRNDFIINYFGNSNSYDTADDRFVFLIEPYMDDFKKGDFKNLLGQINENSQLYDRWNARQNHRKIKKLIESKYKSFDFTPYPNFNT
jgi:hypothetical protein